MTDQILQETRRQAINIVSTPTTSGASRFLPVRTARSNNDGTATKRPPHQSVPGIEQATFLLPIAPQTQSLTAWQNTGYQQAAVQCAHWEIKRQDAIVRKAYIEIVGTWGADAGPVNAGILDGFHWLDRVETKFDFDKEFHTHYSDLALRWAIATNDPQKVQQIGNTCGNFINNPSTPGTTPLVAVHTLDKAGQYAYNTNQMSTAMLRFYPYQYNMLATNFLNAPQRKSKYFKIRIPMTGWWLDQLGIFCLQWIQSGTMVIDAYANRPVYNVAYGADVDPTITSITLLFECLSFPNGPEKEALINAISGEGLSVLYLFQMRQVGVNMGFTNQTTAATIITAASNSGPTKADNTTGVPAYGWGPANYSISSILISGPENKALCQTTVIGRAKSIFSNGNGWLISNDNVGTKQGNLDKSAAPYFILSGPAGPNPAYTCIGGNHTVWGDFEASYPTASIVNSNSQPLFSTTYTNIEALHQQSANNQVTPLMSIGYVPGQDCYAPFLHSDIPFKFHGSEKDTIHGKYLGSIMLPQNSYIRIALGANPDWLILSNLQTT